MIPISQATVDCIERPSRGSTFDWLCENFSDHHGRPFNPIDYPWTRGICDVYDLPHIRTVWLQFAARLGKSLLGMGLLTASCAQDTSTGMIGTATEELLQDTIRDKLWPILTRCPVTAPLCPPKSRQSQRRIDLKTLTMYGAWSGSATRLADKDPRYLWAYEIDKWTTQQSKEADPLKLFLERGLEDPERKAVCECTPTVARHSRVERGLRRGSNCRFKVPCPKCKGHVQLYRGGIDKKTGEFDTNRGGLMWDHTEGGRSEAELARRTARYHCPLCHKEWADDYRKEAISNGKWVPHGCQIDRRGRITGANRDYPSPDASFQLGRIYAPTFTFGDIAADWVQSQGSIEDIRNHINSWDGEVWYPVRIDEEWGVVAARLSTDGYDRGQVPVEGIFLTMGVDVQIDHFVYHVLAFGSESRCWAIEWGICYSWAELEDVKNTVYPHQDGGKPLAISCTMLDARDGNKTDDIRDHAEAWNLDGRWCYASMGQDSTKMSGRPYTKMATDTKKRSKRKGLDDDDNPVYMVNTNYWEQWMDNCLWHRRPGDARSLSYPKVAESDQDLWEQLLNVAPDFDTNAGGETICKYVMVDRAIGKDFRDSVRYGRVAAEVYTRGNWSRVPAERRNIVIPPAAPPQPQKPGFVRQPAAEKPKGKRWVRRFS